MPVPSRAVVPRDIRRYVRGVVRGRGGGKKERKKDGEETSFPTTILDRIDEKHNLVGVWSWVREVQRGSAGEGGGGEREKPRRFPAKYFHIPFATATFPPVSFFSRGRYQKVLAFIRRNENFARTSEGTRERGRKKRVGGGGRLLGGKAI